MATGAGNLKPTRCSRPTTSSCTRLLGTGDPGKMQRALHEILRYQNEDGGWCIYPGGPSNISSSVKCYLACKLMGWLPTSR